jgi:hypothetical protein
MSQTRRLAAILAADVAGYSQLIGPTGNARSNASNHCAASSSIRRSPGGWPCAVGLQPTDLVPRASTTYDRRS